MIQVKSHKRVRKNGVTVVRKHSKKPYNIKKEWDTLHFTHSKLGGASASKNTSIPILRDFKKKGYKLDTKRMNKGIKK